MSWQDHLVQYRRDLHRIPEIGFHEYKTREYLWSRLTEFGLEPKAIGDTGIIADIEGGLPGKTYAIRADIDGLPLPEETGLPFASEHANAMHACGHDAHMAIVLGLAERLTSQRDFAGRVRIMFQPAEERPPGGALELIKGGALEGVDEVYGLHVISDIPLGTAGIRVGALMANADQFTIKIQGVGGHGSQPQNTKDAVLIAAETVVNLQTVVSRRVGAFEPAVVTCGTIRAGHNFNIIAETAEITGTVRTFSEDTQSRIISDIRRIAESTAAMHEATAELIYEKAYPAVINPEREVNRWEERIRDVVAVDHVEPNPGGEDFAYYLHHRPGAFLFLGCAPEQGAAPHHSPHFMVDERCLPLGVEVLYRAIAD